MSGRGGLLALLGVVIVAGLVAVLLMDDGAAPIDVALIEDDTTPSVVPDAPVIATETRGPERIAVPDVSAMEVETQTVERVLPAAYRAALSRVIGRVILEDGTPVVDTPVMIGGARLSTIRVPMEAYYDDPTQIDAEGMLDVIAGRAITDAEGRFEMTDVEPRTIGALMLDPGGPRAYATIMPKTPISGEVTDLGDIVLPAAIRFEGRVIDAAGEPVVDARVRALEVPPFPGIQGVADVRDGSAFVVQDDDVTFFYRPPKRLTRLEKYLPIPTAYTDSEGRFVLEQVPQGMPSVLVDRIDMVPLVHGPVPSGAPGSTRDVGDLRMDAGASLVGHVIDTDGEPIAGAEVLAGNEIGGFVPVSILKGPVFTDETGRFEIPGLSTSTGRAAALSPDRDAFVVGDEVVPGTDEAVIIVPQPRAITAYVTDTNGTPVSGATFFGRSLPDVDADELPNFLKPPAAMPTAADEEAPGVYRLEALDPVVWELAARAPGHGTSVEVIDLSTGDRERLEFELDPGVSLTVRVATARDQEPVEHALVDVFEPGEDFPIKARRTDVDGVARFTDVPQGGLRLLVTHPAFAVHEASTTVGDEGPNESLLLLEAGALVRGSVLDGGRAPEEPMMVSLTRRGKGGRSDLSDALVPLIATTDRDGNFTFHDVDPGEVEIQARPAFEQGFGTTAFGMMMSQSPLAEEELTLTAGEEQNVTLLVGSGYDGIETGSLHGRLLVNGMPPENWSVFVWGKIRRSTSVGPDGSFDLGIVAAGDVELQFSAHGMNFMSRGIAANRTVKVEVGERKFVETSLQVGSVSGRVVSAEDGSPVEGIRVFAQPVEGRARWGSAGGISGADGTFLIEPIEAGEYQLGSWADGYAASTTEPFEITEFSRRSGLQLVVARALALRGTVVVRGLEEDPDFMRLVARRDDTGETDWAWVDRESGEFEFDRLSPGQWTVSLATEYDEEAFNTVAIDVMQVEDDMTLYFDYTPVPEDDEDFPNAAAALKTVSGGK